MAAVEHARCNLSVEEAVPGELAVVHSGCIYITIRFEFSIGLVSFETVKIRSTV